MRTISRKTVLRMREVLNLLAERPVTISEIVRLTSMPNSTSTHKLLARLSSDYGFKIIAEKRSRKAEKCGTRFGVYSLCPTQLARQGSISDIELGKRCSIEALPSKIQQLMSGGYSIDYICAVLDKTRSCVLYHATKHGLDTKVKRDKSTPVKPVVTATDRLTIYMPVPKSLL